MAFLGRGLRDRRSSHPHTGPSQSDTLLVDRDACHLLPPAPRSPGKLSGSCGWGRNMEENPSAPQPHLHPGRFREGWFPEDNWILQLELLLTKQYPLGGLKQQTFLFSPFWEAGSPRSRCRPLLGCRWLSSLCVSSWPFPFVITSLGNPQVCNLLFFSLFFFFLIK